MHRLIEQREQISRKNDARWTETANAGTPQAQLPSSFPRLQKERSQLQSDLRKCKPQSLLSLRSLTLQRMPRSQQENDQLKQQLNSPSAWYKYPALLVE